MSLADEVRTMRERVAARLAELEPLAKEYEELCHLAAELGISAGPARVGGGGPVNAVTPVPVPAPDPSAGEIAAPVMGERSRRGRGGPHQESERQRHVLGAVRTNPGATVAEVASILDTPAKSLYRPVRELTSSGALVKRGRQLFAGSP